MASPSTTNGSPGTAASTSLYLPAQITPFSYNGPGCEQSVFCAGVTSIIYTSLFTQKLGGGPCFGVHAITSEYLHTVETLMGYNNACFPENYFGLFGDQAQQAVWGWPHGTPEGDRSTLAYPGTACPWLWTTACSKTLTHEGLLYPQAWCCPPGHWGCTTALGDTADPQRLCMSVVAESEEVWMSFDPAYTVEPGHEEYTWHIPGGEDGAVVYHKVFPLSLNQNIVLAKETGRNLGIRSPAAVSVVRGIEIGSRLSIGAILGITACTVAMTIIAMWLFIRYRKHHGQGRLTVVHDSVLSPMNGQDASASGGTVTGRLARGEPKTASEASRTAAVV